MLTTPHCRWIKAVAMIIIACCLVDGACAATKTRVKDIVSFEGVRDNQLIGYGLVIGLNGTGDGLSKSTFTKESLISMLERMGVNTREIGNLDTRNVAAVMVTATLPPFSRHGSRLDVVVSAMGDAKNLMGGTLLVTPLMAADGEVYAVAQGPVTASGFSARGQAQSVTKGVPTSGRIASGAIVEREIGFELAHQDSMKLSLRNPDFTTALRICDAINSASNDSVAKALDPGTVQMHIPDVYKDDMVTFLTKIEQLSIIPDQPARIVVDDHDGVIVMGENISISRVAVSHGSLVVKVTEQPIVSQPNPFTSGTGAAGLLAQNTSLNAQGQNLTAGQPLGTFLTQNSLNPTGAAGVPSSPSTLPNTGGAAAPPPTTPTPSSLPSAATGGSSTTPSTTPSVTPSGTTPATTPAAPVIGQQGVNLASLQAGQQNLALQQTPGGAQTTVVPRTTIETNIGIKGNQGAKMAVVESGANIHDLVNSLNALGASPRDMITILQSIKAAGALQASIEVI